MLNRRESSVTVLSRIPAVLHIIIIIQIIQNMMQQSQQSTQASSPAPTPQAEPEAPLAPFNKALINPQNAILKRSLKASEELERLTTETFYNPFDILYLGIEATDEDIKKMYRSFSMILHPDKCKDPRASDAFHTIDQAYKLLQDQDKRKVYVRIMREAREKTEYERVKENKRRQKQGLPALPGCPVLCIIDDTLENDYKKICKEIFMEIEDRRQHLMRLESSQKKQKIEEYERRKMLEQYKVLTDQEWEETRDQRVNKWRDFSSQKKSSIGTKLSDKVDFFDQQREFDHQQQKWNKDLSSLGKTLNSERLRKNSWASHEMKMQ